MIDNFELILPLLEFPFEDNFYFVQILQRKKDHQGERLGGSNNNSRLIKAYYIKSKEHLLIHKEEMIKLNGFHLITNPFNLARFSESFPDIEVHKNNPTLLYMP